MANFYLGVSLVNTWAVAGQGRGAIVIDPPDSEICLLGEVCTKAIAKAGQLKEAQASSSQIATFFIGTFIHGLFSEFTEKPPSAEVKSEGQKPLEYRE